MSRLFSVLSPAETTMSVVAASLLSVATIGVVLAAFSTATPSVTDHDVVVMERVTITAHRTPA
ncbi:MAG TPA: hypothetical protein PLJ16_01650 [Casimicrobium huifangae]|jgi:hypothetical protein|nr:hypothetical protein [Casimicrobium huifangae]HQD63906.1 hypothetical protein [Casimicrobium huifangae]